MTFMPAVDCLHLPRTYLELVVEDYDTVLVASTVTSNNPSLELQMPHF